MKQKAKTPEKVSSKNSLVSVTPVIGGIDNGVPKASSRIVVDVVKIPMGISNGVDTQRVVQAKKAVETPKKSVPSVPSAPVKKTSPSTTGEKPALKQVIEEALRSAGPSGLSASGIRKSVLEKTGHTWSSQSFKFRLDSDGYDKIGDGATAMYKIGAGKS